MQFHPANHRSCNLVLEEVIECIFRMAPFILGYRFMFAADNYDHRATAESRRCILRVLQCRALRYVQAMYHVKFPAVDCLDIAITSLYVGVHIHLHIYLEVSCYCEE